MADSLRTVIGATLAVGAVLTGILVLRGTRYAPEWLQLPAPSAPASANAGAGVPALPPPQPPVPTVGAAPAASSVATPESAPSAAASVASATPEPTASEPPPVASASAGKARKVGAAAVVQPGEPEVVELPADFQYAPKGAGNLTFPAAPATASTSTGQPR